MNAKLPTQGELAQWSGTRTGAVKRARAISMLGEPALALLQQLAIRSEGPIIELGPYIGGSTIAMATGCRHRLVTVELGGPNPRDDHLASENIIADLQRNLRDAGLADKVNIVEGHFRAAAVYDRVFRELAGSSAGMLFVDVDPVRRHRRCSLRDCGEEGSPGKRIYRQIESRRDSPGNRNVRLGYLVWQA
jgi:hypothetical protein